MILIQLAFIGLWVWTYMPALNSLRVLFFRTVIVMGYGWFACEANSPTALSLVCDWMVAADLVSIGMAVWNRDSRFFTYRYGGIQEA